MAEKDALKVALKKISTLKADLAKKRDELREAIEEVEAICESMDDGIEALHEGRECFERALDAMSQYV